MASSRDAIAAPIRPSPKNATRFMRRAYRLRGSEKGTDLFSAQIDRPFWRVCGAENKSVPFSDLLRELLPRSGGKSLERLDRIAGGKDAARERGLGNAEALVQHGFEQRSQVRRRAQVAAFVQVACG